MQFSVWDNGLIKAFLSKETTSSNGVTSAVVPTLSMSCQDARVHHDNRLSFLNSSSIQRFIHISVSPDNTWLKAPKTWVAGNLGIHSPTHTIFCPEVCPAGEWQSAESSLRSACPLKFESWNFSHRMPLCPQLFCRYLIALPGRSWKRWCCLWALLSHITIE